MRYDTAYQLPSNLSRDMKVNGNEGTTQSHNVVQLSLELAFDSRIVWNQTSSHLLFCFYMTKYIVKCYQNVLFYTEKDNSKSNLLKGSGKFCNDVKKDLLKNTPQHFFMTYIWF